MHYLATGTKAEDLYATNGVCPLAFPDCYSDGHCVTSACTSWGTGCGEGENTHYTGTKCVRQQPIPTQTPLNTSRYVTPVPARPCPHAWQ